MTLRSRVHLLLLGLCLFSTLFFCKAWVVGRYGSDMPNWDQWDAEGEFLLLPWKQHRFDWAMLVKPHNEHRVALTKILSLGIVEANGTWDARLQCLANAAFHSGLAVLFFYWFRPHVPRWAAVVWAGAIVVAHAPPNAWQNVLGGFHSQQLFLVGCSVVAIDRLLRCPPWSGGWWLGIVSAWLALGSMGSGFLAAATILTVLPLALRADAPENSGSALRDWFGAVIRQWPTWIALLGVVAVGAISRVEVNYHASLKAHSFRDFYLTFFRAIQWPVTDWGAFAVLNGLPWLILAGWLVWRPRTTNVIDRVLVAVGMWVLVQYLATAYARGDGGQWPASRYLDTVMIGLLVNVAAALRLLTRPALNRPVFAGGLLAFTVWLGFLGHGLTRHVDSVIHGELAPVADEYEHGTANVREFLRTGDRAALREGAIPYPSAAVLHDRLDHPEIRELMPFSVRPALPVNVWSTSLPENGVLPVEAGPAPDLPIWSSQTAGDARTAQWRSAPLRSDGAAVRLWVNASSDHDGLSLRLVPGSSTTGGIDLVPLLQPGAGWQSIVVPLPRSNFTIEMADASALNWIAFSAPVPLPTGSYWAVRLCELAPTASKLCGALLIVALVTSLFLLPPRRTAAPSST